MNKCLLKKLAGVMVMLALALLLAACGGSTPSAEPETMSFISGNYKMDITQESARVAFTPKDGDTYTLYVMVGGTWQRQSSGTVTANESGSFSFTPSSGKPAFTASLEGSTLAVTSTITLDNDEQLLGLSLSENGGASEEPIYTSYTSAKAAGASFGHSDELIAEYVAAGNNVTSALGIKERTLVDALNYTRIKIDGNMPTDDFQPDFVAIGSAASVIAGDYFKWDIEYNDHRVLLSCFYWAGYSSTRSYSYNLVNEILLSRPIDGRDYSAGAILQTTISNADTAWSDTATWRNDQSYTTFTVNDYEPVDNLGLLQYSRILGAIDRTWEAGEFVKWEITYQNSPDTDTDNTTWQLQALVRTINNGKLKGMSFTCVKTTP